MREEIARAVPFYAGVEQLKATADAIQYGGAHLCAGWKFPTSDGKAHFRAVPLPQQVGRVVLNAPAPVFIVSTRRGKQFNSLVYAEVDPINGAPRDAVLMNPEDAASLDLR